MNTRIYLLRNKRLANVRRCEALRRGETDRMLAERQLAAMGLLHCACGAQIQSGTQCGDCISRDAEYWADAHRED